MSNGAMSTELIVEVGAADGFGRRSVVATYGRMEYRDRFNTDDAYRRRQFAEATLTAFGWAVGSDALAEIETLVVSETAARDAQHNVRLQPVITRLADVPPSQVEWLWPQRVALGAVTIVAGDPGLGKSFLTLDIAARVSRGGPWPEELARQSAADALPAAASPASVVLFSAEDDLSKTIRPRLEALGADCERIVALEAVAGRDAEGSYQRPFDMGRDLAQLTAVVERLGDCRLVVIDPISAFLGRVSENANAEVRGLLAPLGELAARRNLAVVAVSHLRKEDGAAVYRTMGSIAFIAAARAAWIVVRDPQAPRRRLLLPVKNNLADDVGGLAYTIEPQGPDGAPVVCWSSERIETAADVASSRAAPERRHDAERQQAVDWLHTYLADGPQLTNDIRAASDALGFSLSTLRRAFRELGGVAVKGVGAKHAGWLWQLPTAAGQVAQPSAPQELSNLTDGGAETSATVSFPLATKST